MAPQNNRDHWAFLEEIEAPMWVDLTVEVAMSNNQNIDDEWFHTSHMFHQCSSQQLKAAFSRSWEENIDFNLDILGQSSPDILTSVSRSRGKDYKSKNWRRGNSNGSFNKPQPVKGLSGKSRSTELGSGEKIKPRTKTVKPKSSRVDSGSGEKIKSRTTSTKPKSSWADSEENKELKPKLSFIGRKGTSSSKSSLVNERSSTTGMKPKSSWVNSEENEEVKPKLGFLSQKGTSSLKSSLVIERTSSAKGNSLKPMSNCGSVGSSSSMLDKASEGGAASTITSDSGLQQQQKFLGTSGQALDNMSGLLSAVRITLRKSCVTRQASRVETNKKQSTKETCNGSTKEINNDRRESRDRKSCSSKSSVGSSSFPGSSVKSSAFISTRKKEQTPDSRNVTRITEATNGLKVSKSNESKVSTVQVKERPLNCRSGNIPSVAKSTFKDITKLKVPNQSIHAKSSLTLRAKEQNSSIGAAKVGFGGSNRSLGVGKEKATGKTFVSQKCRGRENCIGDTNSGQNGTKQNALKKIDTRVTGSKAKISDRREGKNSMPVRQRVFLR